MSLFMQVFLISGVVFTLLAVKAYFLIRYFKNKSDNAK